MKQDPMQQAVRQSDQPAQTEQSKGVVRGFVGAVIGSISWVAREAVIPAMEKLIPQGAAELSQALFTQNAYVPYGPTEMAVPDPPTLESQVMGTIAPEPLGQQEMSPLEQFRGRPVEPARQQEVSR